MTDEGKPWPATALVVAPNTPTAVYVGDAQMVEISHNARTNALITVRRTDTEAASKPDELPVDRCIRLMGELEAALGDGSEGPGFLLLDWRSFTRNLAASRSLLEGIVAAVRGPQATSDPEEADPEEWVECEWTQFVQHEDDSFVHYIVAWPLGAHHLRRQVKQLHLGVTPAAIEEWRRHKPSALPRWVYDQLKPVASDPEEWVECRWVAYGDLGEDQSDDLGVCVRHAGRCLHQHFPRDQVTAWNNREPRRGLPRWAYDQLVPVGSA